MANEDFDRVIINTRERPVSTDLNLQFSQDSQTVRDILYQLGLKQEGGFVGDGFYCTGTGVSLQLSLNPGLGFLYDAAQVASDIDGIPSLNDRSALIPLMLNATQTLTLSAAPSAGNERYDLVEVAINRRRTDSSSRDILNTVTGAFDATSVMKTLAFDLDGDTGTVTSPAASTASISIKQGAVAVLGAGVVPSTTAGYRAVAVIHVPTGTTSLIDNIRDMRVPFWPSSGVSYTFRFTQTIGSPDVLSGVLNPTDKTKLPDSCRVGIKTLGAGPNSAIRVYFFYGDNASLNYFPSATVVSIGTGAKDLLDSVILYTQTTTLSSGDATLLQNAPSSLSICAGQPCMTFDVLPVSVSNTALSVSDVLHHIVTIHG